ncbi:MAG: hypothetical protein LKI42_01385 [Bacteroidales bacterium]|jgi:hypothetical protein|nr:hypothetical protein [Bacteroidales bacterium]MCI1786387.1 hypothetical protein [Bacteroidales bacterium]
MNLRNTKKDIEYVIGAFIDDCSLFQSLSSENEEDGISELIDEAVKLYNDLRDKVNHPDDKKAVFYASLRKELLEKTDALYEKLSALIKESVVKVPEEGQGNDAGADKAVKKASVKETAAKKKAGSATKTAKPAAKKPAVKKPAAKKAEKAAAEEQ